MKTLRGALLAGAAFFSMALTEPQPIPGGDPRYRVVEWRDGIVVKTLAERGRTLMIELPRGLEISDIMPSDQNVITGVVKPEPQNMRGQPPTDNDRSDKEPEENGCATTDNLQTCIRAGRFLFIKPITPLDAQPIPILATRARPGGEPIEYQFIIEISTVKQPDVPYYAVRITMPAPPAAARPIVRRSAPNRPVEPASPPPVNNAYSIEGDRSLLGVQGR